MVSLMIFIYEYIRNSERKAKEKKFNDCFIKFLKIIKCDAMESFSRTIFFGFPSKIYFFTCTIIIQYNTIQ